MTPATRARDQIFDTDPVPLTGRLFVYPRLLLAVYSAITIVGIVLDALGIWDIRFFSDFVAFYSAADLAADGTLAAAFDGDRLLAIQRGVSPEIKGLMPYFYPPSYMLLVFWLPGLPYYFSGAVFITATFWLFLAAVRPLLSDREDLVVLLGAPIVWLNAWHGQNAFLTTALALFAFQWLQQRQVRAGLALAVLTVKPHLGLMWPVVMLLRGRWIAIAVAATGAILLAAGSALVFGPESWRAFFELGLANAHANLSMADLPISLVSSPFAGLTLLGVPERPAALVHILLSFGAIAVLVHLLLRRTPYRLVMAYLFAATLFVTPHNFTYDWMFVLVALLIVWGEARRTGFLRSELLGLMIGYFAPVALQSARKLELPLGPLLLIVVILTVTRRAYAETRRVR